MWPNISCTFLQTIRLNLDMHEHKLMEGKCMKPRKQNNQNKIKKGKKVGKGNGNYDVLLLN
jgi:hypothetical protein